MGEEEKKNKKLKKTLTIHQILREITKIVKMRTRTILSKEEDPI
jgi:hypothetical protein